MSNTVLSQPQKALQLANAVRLPAVRWRRETATLSFADGCFAAADALDNFQPEVNSQRLTQFLMAIRCCGSYMAGTMLSGAGILRRSPTRRVRDLTKPERKRLAAELRRRGGRNR